MVYIYKKSVGAKHYYYLRASERKGNRVLAKDIAYLGGSIKEVRKALAGLPQYKDKIRKAYKTINTFLESNHYLEKAALSKMKKDDFLGKKLVEAEACRFHYMTAFQGYDETTKKEIMKNFIIEFAFNTTSIEGNTISLEDARNLLEDGITPKNKTLREIYDLQNTEKCFFRLGNEDISHALITGIHAGLMENIDQRRGYRTSDVRVIKSNFDATPAPYVKTDMDILLKWYSDNRKKLHPLVLATVFHHKFEKIHPFMDGNGRTGRMLLNQILINAKYPPLIIHKRHRLEYLETLREADDSSLTSHKKEHYSALVRFVASEMTESYWNIFL